MNLRKVVFLLVGAGICIPALGSVGNAESVNSPDGKVSVTVMGDSLARYEVRLDDHLMIEPSALGLVTNLKGGGILTLDSVSEVRLLTDRYELPTGKRAVVDSRASERFFHFGRDGRKAMDVEFRVSDAYVAFRYKVYPQGETLCAVVSEEDTEFVVPENTRAYVCRQMSPMSGWARTAPSYETHYQVDVALDSLSRVAAPDGYSFPCLFRVGDAGWMLISETGIAGDYCASHLDYEGDRIFKIAYPDPAEQNGFGTTGAAIALPGYTPWRIVILGKTLAPIVETTAPWDLVEQLYEPSLDYQYGKGTWSWIMKMDPSCNFDEQKSYIDFAAEMGYSSVLVDALWDTQIGYEGIEELARYGRDKGVSLYLWYNSNGTWNDAPQGPRGVMNDIVKRRKDMRWMAQNGVRGIKVDFFGGDKQETMRLYHDILADANDYGLLVIFHGCTLPRGWERMYPNFVASEAVRASENLHFSQADCDLEALNAALHPFIRNTVGSMDFGGSALNQFYNSKNKPDKGSQRRTSDVFALATAVLFQSPTQHFALAPNNLDDAPEWAIDFMKSVPTLWDETRFVEGRPGEYVVMERRAGDTYYLVGVNAGPEARKLTMNLPTSQGVVKGELYTDDAALAGSVKTVSLNRKGQLKVVMPAEGGFVYKYTVE
ncbi:MAG: glycoside hydrolase family 97 protein [Muribaculaceae bacterium]|nr:glycoside hydrolase family 97 protein [Muribaculaceae bacterium]